MSGRSLSPLDAATATRLAKLCGMFGSDHDGERASAAAKADALVRQLGLTWGQIIVPQLPSPEPWPAPQWRELHWSEAIELCARHPHLMTQWEAQFVANLRRSRRPLSEKQRNVVVNIVAKIRNAFGDAA
jgi:hypothetical protein